MKKILRCLFCLCALALTAGDTVRPGLEGLDEQYMIQNIHEEKLVQAIKNPLIKGLDVQKALQKWFDGRLAQTKGDQTAADKAWKEGLDLLKDLQPLDKPTWEPFPDADLKTLATLRLRNYPDVKLEVVQWSVDNLKQYGVVLSPATAAPGDQFPVILYAHGAAFGVPPSFLGWLADLVRKGYVVVGPAMRGEPLFQQDIPINGTVLNCEGEIENLDGEVNDCLSMLNAIWKRPYVKPNAFAMIGHSFGSGVGLVAAARSGDICKAVVSYDAWLVNPQRYYWDRMARGANNWLSWADFCNQPVKAQLDGLMKRSITHNAQKLKAKLLFFIGGGYEGSVFHQSHDDLFQQLKKHNIPYTYKVMPNAGHNFVLYLGSEPATKALNIQNTFLDKHFPPFKK